MNAQGPQYHGTSKKTGEEDRFRTNVAAQTPLPTRGSMYSKPLPGGRSLEPRKVNSPGTPAHNFKVTKVDDGFRVANGTIRGETPTIGGLPITDPEAVGTLTGSGTEYIWIEVSGTYDLNSNSDFVVGFNSPTYEIQSGSTAPILNHDKANGVFRILIATVAEGLVQRPQPIQNSLDYFVEDTFQGNAEAEINYWGV